MSSIESKVMPLKFEEPAWSLRQEVADMITAMRLLAAADKIEKTEQVGFRKKS